MNGSTGMQNFTQFFKKHTHHLLNRDQSMIVVLVSVRFTDFANVSIHKNNNLKD